MQDLPHGVPRHLDGHVGPVGAHGDAGLAHGMAIEAAFGLAAGVPGVLEMALARQAVGVGHLGFRRDAIGVGFAQHHLGKGLGVRDGLHHRGGAPVGVPGHEYVAVPEGGPALGVHGYPVFRQEGRVNPFAQGGDDRIRRDLYPLLGLHRPAAAALIRISQHHAPAGEGPGFLLFGGKQLRKFHPVPDGQLQLLRVGGHVLFGAAVYQGYPLHSRGGFGGPGRVHGGIAAAHHGHGLAQGQAGGILLIGPQEFDGVVYPAGDGQAAGLFRAHGQQDVFVALGFQLRPGGGGLAADKFRAHGFGQGHVLFDGVQANAEGGDHIPHHAAGLGLLFKHRDRQAGPGQEIACRNAPGASADDGALGALFLFRGLQAGHQGVVAALGGLELGGPDLHRLLVEVAGTFIHAPVGADGAGDKGQGVLFRDKRQGFPVFPLAAQLDVFGDILADRAAVLAGGGEAIQQGHLFAQLPGGQGLDGLLIVGIPVHPVAQAAQGQEVHPGEGLEGLFIEH